MMRILVVASVLLLAGLALVPAASADGSSHSTTNDPTVDAAVHTVLAELDVIEPYCREMLDWGRAEGHFGNESSTDEHRRNEWDHFEQQPACAQLRDQIQYESGHEWSDTTYCRTLYGENCVTVGHIACDIGIVVGSGRVYFCWGGLNPRN